MPSASWEKSNVSTPLRRSRLHPRDGTRLAVADLHNHTLLSDGVGAPEEAYAAMRDAGLDVAALTDHSKVGWGTLSGADPCAQTRRPSRGAKNWCRALLGLHEGGWFTTGALADAADDPGAFTALRGFEWTHPTLGHLNVWGSARWTDPLHTSGIGWDGLGEGAHRIPYLGPTMRRVLRAMPGGPGMRPMWDWLAEHPDAAPRGGGADGLAGFNHPGREPGRFDAFAYDARVADRVVSLEMFNKTDDYLFGGRGASPLVACLDAGWRVGLLGTSDEHGDDWGRPDGKGRAGLWVRELTREGVREALRARRFFATRERGLHLDATVGGARMGGVAAHRSGPVDVAVELAGLAEEAEVQVLRSGTEAPTVVHVEPVPARQAALVRFSVPVDVEEVDGVVLRVASRERDSRRPGPRGHPGNRRALAYASPVWLDPDAPGG